MVVKSSKKQRGPRNIINDLDYKTWLQFQKSFERFNFNADNLPVDFTEIVKSYILFFTKKEILGTPSTVLTNIPLHQSDFDRNIVVLSGDPLTKNWLNDARIYASGKLNYIVLLVRSLERSKEHLIEELFSWFSKALKANAYSTVFCADMNEPRPFVWEFANMCRRFLQLSDEKILLDEENKRAIFYALQFRNSHDKLQQKPFDHSIEVSAQPFPNYIIPKPPPRKKDEIVHPAKFPEQLIQELVKSFTKENDWVLDIMAGTGSALVAAYESKRNSVGIELDSYFYKIAKNRLMKTNPPTRLLDFAPPYVTDIVQGDARNAKNLLSKYHKKFNYCVTSPPYWNMLHNSGSEGQRARRIKKLKLVYSESADDVGNIQDYEKFLSTLRSIYNGLESILTEDGKLTVITKNVKQEGTLYTLAWDLVDELAGKGGKFNFLGYTLWCQDDTPLKPFAIGHHWVSNILHHYCLHFVRRS